MIGINPATLATFESVPFRSPDEVSKGPGFDHARQAVLDTESPDAAKEFRVAVAEVLLANVDASLPQDEAEELLWAAGRRLTPPALDPYSFTYKAGVDWKAQWTAGGTE